MSWTVPSPLRRSGRQSPASIASPNAPETTTASGMATQIGIANPTENNNAARAPNVTISPWAKFDNPVVPNTSDKPIAARASMRPKFSPFTAREAS